MVVIKQGQLEIPQATIDDYQAQLDRIVTRQATRRREGRPDLADKLEWYANNLRQSIDAQKRGLD